MKKLKIGVIGTGYLGKFHAQKYANMDNVDLVGVVDIQKITADKIAKEVQTTAFNNYKDLFGKVDAVSVVVPTPMHFAISKDILEHDIDVLIEKPITTTLEEADELIDIADKNGLLVQVGHLERFNPAVMALADIIKNPMFIESHRLSIFKDRCTDVSVVLDLMIHDVDIILNFVKSEVKTVHASGVPVIQKHVDIANARIEFTNGCIANITTSRISTKNQRKLRLFQRDAYVAIDFAEKAITLIRQNPEAKDAIIPGMEIEQMSFKQGDALEEELKSFVKSVVNREEPAVSGKMARDALKLALEIMQQIQDTSMRFWSR